MTIAVEQRHDAWRPAWIIGGVAIVLLVAINAFTWWIELSDAIDTDALAAEPAVEVWRAYFGAEFTADSLLFVVTAIVTGAILYRDKHNRFAWILGAAFVAVPIVMNPFTGLAVLSVSGQVSSSWTPWIVASLAPVFVLLQAGFVAIVATFPTGRFAPGVWRRAMRFGFGIYMVLGIAAVFQPGPPYDPSYDTDYTFDNPLGVTWLDWMEPVVLDLVLGVLLLVGFASLIARYRQADSEQRHQIKWVVTAMAVLLLGWAIISLMPESSSWSGYALTIGGSVVVLAIAAAITKYRLYDIDIIINRALVFAGLAAFITAIYVGIVVGIGSLFAGSDLWLSIAATALVAIVFEPVRLRLQKWANRLVYGSRATPYEVLSDLTGRLAETENEEGLLERMAQRLSEGTGAERAVVWLADEKSMHAAAVAPSNGEVLRESIEFTSLPGVAVPIEHEGETLGALSIEKARGDALTPTERRLMEDLAGSAGLVVRRLRLDEELEAKAAQLEESRRRLLDAQDVERRRLERDLHDGAQQHVVAMTEKLRLAGRVAADEGTEKTAMLIDQMAHEADDAIAQIRSLAQGIYPPLLETGGLEQAIPALAAQSPQEVRTDIQVTGRYPLPLEGAVYFCVSEALTNAAKHAAGPVRVTVSDADGALSFSVTDSGPGFDAVTVGRGAGLDNMADRLDVLGGSVQIDSAPGSPTVVMGELPVYAATQ